MAILKHIKRSVITEWPCIETQEQTFHLYHSITITIIIYCCIEYQHYFYVDLLHAIMFADADFTNLQWPPQTQSLP